VSVHEPVLLQEVIDALDPQPGKFFIDGTMDGGGHAAALLARLGPEGKLLGIEWDAQVLAVGEARIEREVPHASQSLVTMLGSYTDLPDILRKKKLPQADGLLLDLGFSSEQLETSGRGFSFRKDEPLLMTYGEESEPVRAILRRLSEKELAEIIRTYGGERFSGRIARSIKEMGAKRSIDTTGMLREAVVRAVPKGYERGRIDPATRTFQALRIYANGELANVAQAMKDLPLTVKPGGRVAVITFHSLEDRAVKLAFRELVKEGRAELLTKKPLGPTREEMRRNPRSRSAKLRSLVMKEPVPETYSHLKKRK
jgi:16S rRNA (cytosine1402-N4)-methyltransferase